jgi:diguanylate cyclase (GGDEF)-like protein
VLQVVDRSPVCRVHALLRRLAVPALTAILSLPAFPAASCSAEANSRPAIDLPVLPRAQSHADSAKDLKATPLVLTTAREAHNLSVEQASRGFPVHLRGVITYFDPDYAGGLPAIFIHDATGGVFLRATGRQAAGLFVGAHVDVRGISAPGGFGPIVLNPQITILGRSPLPPDPPRVSLALLKTGAYDAQWVEVEGSVHRVIEYAHSVTLSLELLDGPIAVTMIREPGETYSRLVDAQVRVRANAAPTTNADDQMIGVHLQAPNIAAVQVVQPAPVDAFAGSYVPVKQLLQWEYFSTPLHRVHVRGVVTLQWPGSSLCIRDATRGICAQTTQANPVAVGDQVDVAGFLQTDNRVPVLTDAVFRDAGNQRPAAPQPATADKILSGGFISELVQIDGQLIGYDLASSDVTLQLASGDTLFPVVLPKNLAGPRASAWRIGSKLRITGICSAALDTQTNVRAGVAVTKSFRILMRSPADVAILEQPSWWTPSHALVVLALALTVTLAVLGWVVVLRRRVEEQTRLLRESEERFRHMALHDALTGLATRLLLQDRLEVALEGARRHGTGLAIIMVDLDKFKNVNDTFGHQAGDEVLRATAGRLLRTVRKGDTVARVGGDEFTILLPDLVDLQAAERIAAGIVDTMAFPIPLGENSVFATASVGVCLSLEGELDGNSLLANADLALYRAKARGRNVFKVYEPGMENPHPQSVAARA